MITMQSAEPEDSQDVRHSEPGYDELLTVHDAARLLNVSVSWVYEHTRDNADDRLPVLKLGKYVRFERRDLRAYVEVKRDAARTRRRR